VTPDKNDTPRRASIVSGYFNPLHQGHLDMFEAARERTGYLIVVVNNDEQQLLKKGRIIQDVDARTRIVRAMRVVDDVVVAVESTPHLDGTLDLVRSRYPDTDLEFCNGGDRSSAANLPDAERAAAERNEITLVYGVGGTEKADSSTRVQGALEGDGEV
jgi:glycerol-3-phosphate cytidylyltransferase/D-beta-D-heptose 7-phosphate kinase/D-beta-D-heptose 1-phosphate adenosyltransferase